MRVTNNERGFQVLGHPGYPDCGTDRRVVQQSSAIGDYEDSFDKPGSSYLWFGESHHLNREEVGEVVKCLQTWLATGRLDNSEVAQ